MIGDVLWEPPADLRSSTEIGRFMASAGKASYDELWRWSVSDLEGFWGSLSEFLWAALARSL